MKMVSAARLAVAWLTMFLVGTELFVFSPLLPLIAADYHVSAGAAGLSVAIFALSYMLGAPLFGHVSDRIGRRRVLGWSLMVFAAANLLTALAPGLSSLLAIRLLAGASAAGISPAIYALAGDAAPPGRRATWLALTASGLLVSLAVGASTAAIAGALFGWPSIFATLAALSLAAAWLNRRVWPAGVTVCSQTAAPDLDTIAALVRRLVPTVVWSTSLYGVYTYLGTGLTAAGFSAEQTARMILCYGIGAVIGAVIGGRSADRFGVKWTGGASFAGLCAYLLLLRAALDAGTLVELAIAATSAVAQLFFPAQQVGLTDDFPRHRGAALAWNNSALFFGIFLGSAIGGQAVALGGFGTSLSVSAGIALFGWFVNALVMPSRAPLDIRCVTDRR